MTTEGWMVVVCVRSHAEADGCEESTPVAQPGFAYGGATRTNLRSNAIRHTVDALASRGDEGRDKLR